jgi:hypothetical protein
VIETFVHKFILCRDGSTYQTFNSNHHGSKKEEGSKEDCKEGRKEKKGRKEARIVSQVSSDTCEKKNPTSVGFFFLDW